MREYYELLAEKEDIVTDGGGKLTPEDFEDNEDGTVSIVEKVKDGDKELNIRLNFNKDTGEYIDYASLDSEDDVTDDDIIASEPKIDEKGHTIGSLYKQQMQNKRVVPDLEKKLAEKEAEIERLKRENKSLKYSNDAMTDDEAKEFFGVDTVDEVDELRTDNFAKWTKCMARYSASLITPVAVETKAPERKPTVARPQRIAPKSVPEGAGGGNGKKPKASRDDALANSIVFGVTKT